MAARMPDYRPFLEPAYRDEFEAFLVEYQKSGVLTIDAANIADRLDADVAAWWKDEVAAPGRLDAMWNPDRRLIEMDREGITAEVLFQEFATPFVMSSPTRAASRNVRQASIDQLSAGYRAYNRWLAEFRRVAPERWLGMAAMSFHDIEATVKELHEVKALGFAGCAIPAVPETERLYQAKYDPLWATMADLELVANVHVAIANRIPQYTGAPTLTATRALVGADIFTEARNILPTLVLGGVLERHPNLKVVFTETHSDWVVGVLRRMDHAYQRSDLRRDIREVIPLPPSDYWKRQCYLGSSIFSRAEIKARATIGIDKMMIGMDFPHSEGAWRFGTLNYLKATFGAERVPERELRAMLGETAAAVYGFDLGALQAVADGVGLSAADVLLPPAIQPTYRGDLDRPLVPA
ncbi:MAG TPA: amidohydrolase family protein [Pseudonocardia sp.]